MEESKEVILNSSDNKNKYYRNLYHTNSDYKKKIQDLNRKKYKRKTVSCTKCFKRVYLCDLDEDITDFDTWECTYCTNNVKFKSRPRGRPKLEKEKLIIMADQIDKTQFSYLCPFMCDKKYHSHGSVGEMHNRLEHRVSHCLKNNDDVWIYISDNTQRVEQITTSEKKRKHLKKLIIK